MSVIKLAIKNVVSQLSVKAKVSAASVDLVTRLSLVEFQANGTDFENLWHKKIICPP